MVKIALIGYGKMGKTIASLAEEKGFRVVSIIDPFCQGCHREISKESLSGAEVAIDFSHPQGIVQNLKKLIELKQNTVVGTTGWNEHQAEIRALATEAGIGFVYGANFSLGMNLFQELIREAVKLFDPFEDYDLLGWEKHHAMKADSPSGSAIEMVNNILANSSRKKKVVYDKLDRRIEEDELHFASIRGGKIPGTHALAFDSEADTIEIIHTVRSRQTFASGALLAAKWLKGKSGVYTFREILGQMK